MAKPYLRIKPTPENLMERIWSRIDKREPDECWEWTGNYTAAGYGTTVGIVGATIPLAHRFMWTVLVGEIPDGLNVLHTCDNPPCVNPAHLWLGTIADNNWDRNRKGRRYYTFGQDHHNAVLTTAQVEEIRASNLSQNTLARQYGVSQAHIWRIKHRETRING